jgi:signal transduction histidine kinase
VRQFFIQNETILLFAQGLVFFSLALAVWLQRRRATRLTLSSSLIWLATFAFVEALAVWGQAFIPIQQDYMDPDVIRVLEVLRALVQIAAFLFLLQFGLRLMGWSLVVRRVLIAVGVLAAVSTVIITGLAAGSMNWEIAEWESAVVAISRYTLLIPAALLSAVGLWRQRTELSAAGMTAIKPYAAAAAAVLAVYALAAGTIVGPGPLSPGGLGDSDGWFDVTGVPIIVIHALMGLALAVLAVKLLEIFDAEANQRIEALDRARAIAEERARFRRDLHDGTIQSIYAAGLHLESVAIRCEDPAVRGEVREVVADLNAVTDGIRDYIRALAQSPATPEGIATGLADLTRRFAEETGRDAEFHVEGVATAGPLPDEAGQHIEQILREALSNSARHAGPCRVEVALRFGPDELDLVVADDGSGPGSALFGEGDGQGLRNMRERARRLGGRVTVEARPGGGTRVNLSVPLDSEVPAGEPLPFEPFSEVTLR